MPFVLNEMSGCCTGFGEWSLLSLRRTFCRGLLVWGLCVGLACNEAQAEPDYARDVRPILAEFCFRCHGFDAATREGGLRLDRPVDAMQPADSGERAIVSGSALQSELWRRINHADADVRMPPAETGKVLTAAQRELLRDWIDAGAPYAEHWAFQQPQRAPTPQVEGSNWPRNWIDAFILQGLERTDLHPAPLADPTRLLRRVSLDLTGLPPTPADLDRFLLAAQSDLEGAYAAEVDRLLASPHYGERMAVDWLDAARYADTNGYFGDRPRQLWPWRDWVIRAFNANMPFDQFTLEQLAGDLLPNPSTSQLIASGFHRNSMANNETGIIDEEFRVEAVADRVETTATVWLGMTLACAQCHDHKFDPVSQRDYYRFFAYFNNTVEQGLVTRDNPPPTLELPTPEQAAQLAAAVAERRKLEPQVEQAQQDLNELFVDWQAAKLMKLSPFPNAAVLICDFGDDIPGASADAAPDSATGAESENPVVAESSVWRLIGETLPREAGLHRQAGRFDATQHLEARPDLSWDAAWTIGVWMQSRQSLGGLWAQMEGTDRRRGIELVQQKGRLQLNLVEHWGERELILLTREPLPAASRWTHVVVTHDGSRRAAGVRIYLNGRPVPVVVLRDTVEGTITSDEPFRLGRRDAGLGFYGLLDQFRLWKAALSPETVQRWSEDERLGGALERPESSRTAAEKELLLEMFIHEQAAPELQQLYAQLQAVRAREQQLRDAIPSTLIMQERCEPRPTHILERGVYDQPGEQVQPGVPEVFRSVIEPPDEQLPADRLALAQWLTHPRQPLTPRVVVNRLWSLCFGAGLVRTPDDFGLQGALPTHPELLDALAVEFVESGWDVKQLLKLIVTSATYRQDSRPDEVQLARDPENRLWSRGPRFRLQAEFVRDQALAVSGLLNPELGGPSIKPWQPPGLWEEVSYNSEETYVPAEDDSQWRRSLYMYWKRQAPPPAMLIFDANPRERCSVARSRTNTPLQALVTLNDPLYITAARKLAQRFTFPTQDNSEQSELEHSKFSDESRLRNLFREVLCRWPSPGELAIAQELLQSQRLWLREHPEQARQLAHADFHSTDSLSATDASTRNLDVGHATREATPATTPVLGESRKSDLELAAWTLVAHALLNLDEMVTRR